MNMTGSVIQSRLKLVSPLAATTLISIRAGYTVPAIFTGQAQRPSWNYPLGIHPWARFLRHQQPPHGQYIGIREGESDCLLTRFHEAIRSDE